jgi:hypothetical protein
MASVTDELIFDPKVDDSGIAVSADRGTVTLCGTVGSFRENSARRRRQQSGSAASIELGEHLERGGRASAPSPTRLPRRPKQLDHLVAFDGYNTVCDAGPPQRGPDTIELNFSVRTPVPR